MCPALLFLTSFNTFYLGTLTNQLQRLGVDGPALCYSQWLLLCIVLQVWMLSPLLFKIYMKQLGEISSVC